MLLETGRLILKPYKHEFADVIYPVVSQAKIADTMITIPHPYPKDIVNKWIDYLHKSAKEGTAFEFAVFLKENPEKYIRNEIVDLSVFPTITERQRSPTLLIRMSGEKATQLK